MKKIKSYTGIWNVEKVLYAINDFNLPFPVTFTPVSYTHLSMRKGKSRSPPIPYRQTSAYSGLSANNLQEHG